MNIGEVAKRSAVNAKAIRYYESIGLVPEPARTESGYRQYSNRDIERLRLIGRARRLGFTIDDARRLVEIFDSQQDEGDSDVQGVVLQHVGQIDRKIAELNSIRHSLIDLAERCAEAQEPATEVLDEIDQDHKIAERSPTAPTEPIGDSAPEEIAPEDGIDGLKADEILNVDSGLEAEVDDSSEGQT